MALLKFDPTAAVAGVISAHLVLTSILTVLFLWKDFHDAVCRLTSPDQFCHDSHGFLRMLEESLVPGTEIIQSWFSIGRLEKTVLETFPIANR